MWTMDQTAIGAALKVISLVFALLAALGSAKAQTKEDFNYPSMLCVNKTGDHDQCSSFTVQSKLYLPAAPTKTLVVITHGSQGLDARHTEYAKALNAAGMAALVIDHWGSRGIRNIYTDYKKGWDKGADSINMAMDAMHAVALLNGRFTKFGYLGESQGGNAVIWADKLHTAQMYKRVFHADAPHFDAMAALFPGCFERYAGEFYLPTPVVMISGSDDNLTPAPLCQRYKGWMNSNGGRVQFISLPGQHHDFDAPYYARSSGSTAENSSHCASYIERSHRKWEETGEVFPLNTEGNASFWKKCIQAGSGTAVISGNSGDPKTGYKQWLAFFQANLPH